jgi:excisionase family DNA binding protein
MHPVSTLRAEPLLSLEEVAVYLGVKPGLVKRLVREGRLSSIRLGRFWRVAPEDLHDFVAYQRIARSRYGTDWTDEDEDLLADLR